jgi:hypothetical protein
MEWECNKSRKIPLYTEEQGKRDSTLFKKGSYGNNMEISAAIRESTFGWMPFLPSDHQKALA